MLKPYKIVLRYSENTRPRVIASVHLPAPDIRPDLLAELGAAPAAASRVGGRRRDAAAARLWRTSNADFCIF